MSMEDSELGITVVPGLGGKTQVSWQPLKMVNNVTVTKSVLQQVEGDTSTWKDIAVQHAVSDVLARVVASVTIPKDKQLQFRAVSYTQQQDVTGQITFSVLVASATCTLLRVAERFTPKVVMATGSSLILKWPNGGVSHDGLLLHGDNQLTVFLSERARQRKDACESQGSVVDEDAETRVFMPISPMRLKVWS